MTYMTQFFLLIMGLGFMVFGVHNFFDPSNLVVSQAAETMSSDGIYELRSIYGGTSLGAGLLLMIASIRVSLKRPALFLIIAYMGGYSLARLAAVPLDGMPSGRLLNVWIVEIICVFIAVFLLRKISSQAPDLK